MSTVLRRKGMSPKMSSEFSTDSIESLGTSSGGPLPRSATMALSLSTFNEAVESATAGYGVCRATVNYAGEEMSFWVEGGVEEIVKRAIGCAMIIRMPNEGVEEAVSCVKDVLAFYSEMYPLMLPQAPITERRSGRLTRMSQLPDQLIS